MGQQRADRRKAEEEIQPLVKKEVAQQEVTQHKADEQHRQQRRAAAQPAHPGQETAPMDPQQQAEKAQGAQAWAR